MDQIAFLSQPSGPSPYVSMFDEALKLTACTRFRAAVAYATDGGVDALRSIVQWHHEALWAAAQKQWLVGIDWCRSDPTALDALAAINKSGVRVHDGGNVAYRRGCVPTRPFHPKLFLFEGKAVVALVYGSGNLSRSGMTSGHEFGSLVAFKRSGRRRTPTPWAQVFSWFDKSFAAASEWESVRPRYEIEYEARPSQPILPDEDSVGRHAAGRQKAQPIPDHKLSLLRCSQHLWIRFLTNKNRGPDKPGTQLLMSARTRVFFGGLPDDVVDNTDYPPIDVVYQGYRHRGCTLRYNRIDMDVLTLPIPGYEAPDSYDERYLLFRRVGLRVFEMHVGTPAAVKRWRMQSSNIGGYFQMKSGREWGVF